MNSTPRIHDQRPADHRSVPLLTEPELGHYPEFAQFFSETFKLDADPLRAPGLIDIDGRCCELVFLGRSGRPFPNGVEISALVPGLEPLEREQADRGLSWILEWIVEGVGEPWTRNGLNETGRIYRIPNARDTV